MTEVLKSEFNLTPLLFIVPGVVVAMVIMKFDAVVALFIGTILGAVFAIIFQPHVVTQVATMPEIGSVADAESDLQSQKDSVELGILRETLMGEELGKAKEEIVKAEKSLEEANASLESARTTPFLKRAYLATVNCMFGSVALTTESGNADAEDLLQSKGMSGMLNTIWLIVMAMCFGGVMEACGLLKRITDPLVSLAQSDGALVATTAGSCIFTNVTASDQYLSIVVPGRMFRETYAERGLAPENLSRTLEDSGTVTSALVPWNTCAAFHSGALGVAATTFAPFCLFNIISPLMTISIAVLGIKIRRLTKKKSPDQTENY